MLDISHNFIEHKLDIKLILLVQTITNYQIQETSSTT
jgi:hypothetical protein